MAIRKVLRGFILTTAVLLAAIGLTSKVSAADKLMPFILASTAGDDLQQAVSTVKDALADEGFEVVGEYSPIEDTVIVVATNGFLRKLAAEEDGGAYFAPQRIAVSKVAGRVQVAYTNPEYWSSVYRVEQNVDQVTEKLKAALGAEKEFGSRGLSPRKLEKYHYTFGMEYFDDQLKLADYGSHAEAVRELERNLKKGVAGASEVYRIDARGGDVTIFGVSMTEDFSGDKTILEKVDVQPLKHAAHLPYEVVVFGDKVRALAPRFRIAISWPDLKMVGDHSFFEITRSPAEIEKVLTLVAGGKLEKSTAGGFNIQ